MLFGYLLRHYFLIDPLDEENSGDIGDRTGLADQPSIDVSALELAARARGVPLQVLDLDTPDTQSGYAGKLVPSRPDQHVAWRGESAPEDPVQLTARVRGAGDAAR